MPITTVLFDLDGTLLPMDQDVFVKGYMTLLATRMAPYGYEPKALVKAIWDGTTAMVKNDGAKTNEEVFWDCFSVPYGEKAVTDKPIIDDFYREEFCKARSACGFNPQAAEAVKAIQDMGLTVALATNPLFPAAATRHRIRWAGLNPEDFALYTTYENSCHCKPNLEYYKDVIRELGVSAEECLMVGNDVQEDMVAEKLGMKVFLLTDCLISRTEEDLSRYPQGSFTELLDYIRQISR